ncbi:MULTISPECIES: hypothetical protein [Erwinia]|uniref:hypothetical protein n=1 Tax=Erwinia TaxID=551 RepID=UPI00105FDAEB|nr:MULTISPECIES: hypothetical protein [Erwinia]NNS08949.1 hypothetical protein [Erwinia sp. JH02]
MKNAFYYPVVIGAPGQSLNKSFLLALMPDVTGTLCISVIIMQKAVEFTITHTEIFTTPLSFPPERLGLRRVSF